MSQSASLHPASFPPTHSAILFLTSGCSGIADVHSRRKATTFGSDSRKKRCSERRSSGLAPVSTEYGFLSSVGAYVELQFSQTSPYWSLVPHFGHSPLM